jgi:flavin-dependent dehydrogenase
VSTTFDVAVIGAGPAGSGAAAALAMRGWRVLLLEQDRFPRHKVCGEFLSPESQATLATLGLYDELAVLNPVPLTRAALVSRKGTELQTNLPGIAWGLSRYAMDEALAAGAERHGATLWQRSRVTDLQRTPDGIVLQVRQGAETQQIQVRAALLAAGRSVNASLSAKPVQRSSAKLNVGIKAHFTGLAMPNQVEIYLFEGGYVGINPVESGAANVCLLASYDALAAADRDPRAVFQMIAQQNPAFRARVAAAHLFDETLCTVGAVDTGRPGRPWNGVACLGDSASMIPPLCGDGMAMALHSAALCAPLADAFLRGQIELAEWEARYAAAWNGTFTPRLRTGRALQAVLTSRAAEILLHAGNLLPPAAAYFVRATRGTVEPPASTAVTG